MDRGATILDILSDHVISAVPLGEGTPINDGGAKIYTFWG